VSSLMNLVRMAVVLPFILGAAIAGASLDNQD
jgi:hypothetical protein